MAQCIPFIRRCLSFPQFVDALTIGFDFCGGERGVFVDKTRKFLIVVWTEVEASWRGVYHGC